MHMRSKRLYGCLKVILIGYLHAAVTSVLFLADTLTPTTSVIPLTVSHRSHGLGKGHLTSRVWG
jgi:hypothetical protein